MQPKIRGMMIMGMVMLMVSLGHLLTPIFEDETIWWTPKEKALSLQAAQDRVRILVAGKPIEDAIAQDRLCLDKMPLEMDDFALRLNNWNARQLTLWKKAAFGSGLSGAGLALILAGLWLQRAMKKSEPEVV